MAPALALAPLVLAELLADRAPARHASDLAVQNVLGAEVRVFSEVRVFATWHAGNRIVWQSCTSMMFWHGECAVHGVVRRELRAAHCFQNPRLSSLFNNVTTGERELQKKRELDLEPAL